MNFQPHINSLKKYLFRQPAPTLASIVGPLPAGYNMLPTPGGTQGFQTDWTDFANVRNWSVTGTEFGGTAAQLTLVPGQPGPVSGNHATRLVETTFNGNHSVVAFPGSPYPIPAWNGLDAPIPVRIAAIARANERTRAVLSFGDGNVSAAYKMSVGFDIAGGNTNYDNSIGANMSLIGTPQMTSLGGGWWLFYFDHFVSSGALTATTVSNNTYQPALYLDNGSGTAARSISYVGDVTKGLEVLWFNMLPVAMWNMSMLAFQDDFTSLSTIDLTNSKAPGFNWYINNRFQNSGPNGAVLGVGDWGNFWNVAGTHIPSVTSNFSIVSPSVLQMYEPTVSASPGYTNQLWSVVSTSNTPGTVPGYIGSAFPGPLFVEWSMVTDTSVAAANPNWQGDGVIIWGSSTASLTQVGLAGDGKAHMTEWDMSGGGNRVRFVGGSITAANHDWFDPYQDFQFQGSMGTLFTIPPTVDSPEMNFTNGLRKSGCLWVNCAYNNYTWGFYIAFGDGAWTPPLQPYNPAGLIYGSAPTIAGFLSLADGHKFPLFISVAGSNNAGAPTGMKLQVDWVKAWTVASPPTVYAFWNAFDMGTAGAAGLTSTLSQNGYQLTKPGADANWQSARAHKCIGYNNVGLPFSGGVSTGKWYWEHTLTGTLNSGNSVILGIGNSGATIVGSYPGGSANGAGLQHATAANSNVNGVTGLTASSVTFTNGDVIGFAFDADAGHVYIHKNGTYINGNPGSGNGVWTVTGDTWWPMVGMNTAGSSNAITTNFGQAAFAFTVPTGYNAGVF